MEGPNEEAEASISTENVREGPNTTLNTNGASALRRKAAKRTLSWDLTAGELDLVSPPQRQAKDNPATKKPRLEEPISASTDEANANTAPDQATAALPTDANVETRRCRSREGQSYLGECLLDTRRRLKAEPCSYKYPQEEVGYGEQDRLVCCSCNGSRSNQIAVPAQMELLLGCQDRPSDWTHG
jgi:hypothetical protein